MMIFSPQDLYNIIINIIMTPLRGIINVKKGNDNSSITMYDTQFI
jgi:hypothetical protein